MAMTKAARVAKELWLKSQPSKAMNKTDAARVEAAIRKNPQQFKGLSPQEVLSMLPPKGMSGKVIGKKIVKKKVGSTIAKGAKWVADKLKKKVDKKGNTKSPFRSPSAKQQKTKKAIQGTHTAKQGKWTGRGQGAILATLGALTINNLSKDKSAIGKEEKDNKKKKKNNLQSLPKPKPKNIQKNKKKKVYWKESNTNKDSNVEFGTGKTIKKFKYGSKGRTIGKSKSGMSSGPSPCNRLY